MSDEFRLLVDPKKGDYVPGSMFQVERELGKSIKILEDRAWVSPDDPTLFRKLARARFRLWQMNLDQGSLVVAREAYQKALSINENQAVAGLWAETAQVHCPSLWLCGMLHQCRSAHVDSCRAACARVCMARQLSSVVASSRQRTLFVSVLRQPLLKHSRPVAVLAACAVVCRGGCV
jgi:hypothetical protein